MTFSSISQKIKFASEFDKLEDLGNGIKKQQWIIILEAIEKAYVKSNIVRKMFKRQYKSTIYRMTLPLKLTRVYLE
jgi:hypothetical protein